jgi:Zn-dependent peptidase ImmA (M78 family)/transcriptional regulator with XRE-family HTH domain
MWLTFVRSGSRIRPGNKERMISSQQLGERIVAARKRQKSTQADFATQLGVSRTTFVAMEKGERRPTSTELMRLATILGISVNELLREHGVVGEVAPRFRMGPISGIETGEAASAVERVRKMAASYVELERLHGIERVPGRLATIEMYRATTAGARVDPSFAGRDAALTVRSALGLGDAPALALDERFEVEAGVRIFYPRLGRSVAALFLWSDELGACIAVNRDHPHERRRWSLAHEIGHFLRDREAGDVFPATGHPRSDPSEIFSEAFAAEFLLPESGLSKQVGDRQRANGGRFTPPDVVALAHLYDVSFEAMALRLEEIGALHKGTYERLRAHRFKPHEAQAKLGLSRPKASVPVLPDRYVTLALQAYAEELISEGDLAEYLETDRVTARGIYLAACHQPTGDDGVIDLPLGQDLMQPGGQTAP